MIRSLALIALTGAVLLLVALGPFALGEDSQGANPSQAGILPTPGFAVEGNRVTGTSVAFTYSPESGPIINFTHLPTRADRPGSLLIFQSVAIPGYHPVGNAVTEGSLFLADGGVANLTVHDNPTALVQISVKEPLTLVLTLGQERPSGGASNLCGGRVLVLDEPLHGFIISVEGSILVLGDRVSVTFDGPGTLLFKLAPLGDQVSEGEEDAISAAICDQRVGAEVTIGLGANGSFMADRAHYRADARVEVERAARDHLKLRVRGMKSEGTGVFLRLDSSVIPSQDLPGLAVKMDGVAASMAPLTAVLFSRGSSPQDARYAVLAQGQGLALVAYIPRLSPQGVELTIDASSGPVIDAPTLEVMAIGVAVVALATVVLFRRRH